MKSVLVVDDDYSVREMFRYLLADLGYEVRVARNGFEGLQAVIASRPSLILTDISMPEMTGIEFTTSLREHPDATINSIPFVVLTGESTIDTRLQQHFQQNPNCRAFFPKMSDTESVARFIAGQLGPA